MAKLSYEQLQASFNRQMLGGQTNRVALLKRVLDKLGHPDHQYRIIHVAGTNGKGSTGHLLTAILQQAGFRVGHFNSPVMVDQRQQIQLNNRSISKQAFVHTYYQIKKALPAGTTPADLTIFEWWTLIMLQYFANAHVQWAVIEVGLGGTDDATNCIDAPEYAVITHLALDHTRILGPQITDIARAKAGIIKPGTRAVVLAPHQQPAARLIIQQRAEQQGVKFIDSTSQVVVKRYGPPTLEGQPLKIQSAVVPLMSVKLHMLGDYQLANLTTVLSVTDQLCQHGIQITAEGVHQAIEQSVLPGRLQVVSRHPAIILDGAHNPDGASELVKSIINLKLDHHPLALVIGFLADKDFRTMVKDFRTLPAKFFVTTPANPDRALPVNELSQLLPDSRQFVDGPSALKAAVANVGETGAVIVTGSFYLIKEIETLVHNDEEVSP